jgi:hypothetical protein
MLCHAARIGPIDANVLAGTGIFARIRLGRYALKLHFRARARWSPRPGLIDQASENRLQRILNILGCIGNCIARFFNVAARAFGGFAGGQGNQGKT